MHFQEPGVVEHSEVQQKIPFWQSKVGVAIRWIFFIPAGFLGGALATIAISLFMKAQNWMGGMPTDAPIIKLVAAGASGYLTIYIGTACAPSEKKLAPAIVVGTLLIMMCGTIIFVTSIKREWFEVVQALTTLIVSGFTMFYIARDEK